MLYRIPRPSILSSLFLSTAILSLSAACWTSIEAADTVSAKNNHPLNPAIKIARQSLAVCDKQSQIAATFHKRELVGRRISQHSMDIKLRDKPFSVYMKFHKPYEGREVIYVDGKHENKLLVHDNGLASLVGTIAVAPDGPEAMAESRHPITKIGPKNMLKTVLEQWTQELKHPEDETEVKYYPNASLGEQKCKVIETLHPQKKPHYKFHITRLYIDKATQMPVRVEQYGFPKRSGAKAPLIEEYTYANIHTDVTFNDVDFDTRNPNYGFK